MASTHIDISPILQRLTEAITETRVAAGRMNAAFQRLRETGEAANGKTLKRARYYRRYANRGKAT